MYKALDLITEDYIKLPVTSTIEEVLKAFVNYRTDIACIVSSENTLLGIITKYIIYRQLLNGVSLKTPVDSLYRTDVVALNVDDDLNIIRDKLLSANIAHAVVVNEENKLCGVISKGDLIRALHWERDIFINRLDLIIENIPVGIVVVDKNDIITHSNKTTNHMLGLENQKLFNSNFPDFFPELRSHLTEVSLSKKKLLLPKIRVRNLNCFVTLIPLFEPELDSILIIFQELSSLENLALELKTTQGLVNILQTVMDNTYDYLMITDLLGNITFYNQNIPELLSNSYASLLNINILDIMPVLAQKQLALLPEEYYEVIKIGQKNCLVSIHKVRSNQEIYGYVFKIDYKQTDQNLLSRLHTLESIIGTTKLDSQAKEEEFACLKEIISVNPAIAKIKKELHLIAQTGSTVLILGESGTGKELIANAVHQLSGRSGNYIKINCAAIPLELLESELFGYEEGAFTGAKKGGKPGKFEMADLGTVFLDEIGDMPMSLQAKLLRVLEEKCFERIGSTKTLTSDVRFIAATNKNLRNLIQEGKFREDLFYRLNVIKFEIPPLKERTEDIPVLVRHFLQVLNTKYQKYITDLSPEAVNTLVNHSWHGNVRELINVMERAVIWCQDSIIAQEHINFLGEKAPVNPVYDSKDKQALINLLQKYKGNKSKVAKHLGLSRVTLYKKLKAYGITENALYN